MFGRRDSEDFQRGLAVCRNAIIGERGEWHRRPGTRFVQQCENNAPTRLIDLITATQQPVLIEFSHQSVRINVFDENATTQTTLATPYEVDDLWKLDWTQSGNTLFLVHERHPPARLVLEQTTGSWQYEPLALVDGPYLTANTDPARVLSVVGAQVNATNFAPFRSEDEGRQLRVKFSGGRWAWGTVVTYWSPTQVFVQWGNQESTAAANSGSITNEFEWQLGSFWQENFPTAISFHEDRLVMAATNVNPQTLWTSALGDYLNFSPSETDDSVLDTTGIQVALNDRQINRIQWLVSQDENLVAGTASGLWLINSGSLGSGLTPSNIQAQRLSGANSSDVRPAFVGRSMLFVERSGRRLLSLKRDTAELRYITPDISVRSEHLLSPGITSICFQAVPWSVNWSLMSDGTLCGLTIVEQEELLGWHRHDIAGPDARVLSIACLPGKRTDNDRAQDQLFMVVERQINGSSFYSVEVLGDRFEHSTDLALAQYLDGMIDSQDSGAGHSPLDFSHLSGLALTSLVDGAVGPVPTGSSAVSVPAGAQNYAAGLGFESEGRLLDVDAGSLIGTADGKPRRVYEVVLKLWRSVGLEASNNGDWVAYSGDDVERRTGELVDDPLSGRPGAFTGDIRVKRDQGGWERQVVAGWRVSGPTPLSVLSATLRMNTSDG